MIITRFVDVDERKLIWIMMRQVRLSPMLRSLAVSSRIRSRLRRKSRSSGERLRHSYLRHRECESTMFALRSRSD